MNKGHTNIFSNEENIKERKKIEKHKNIYHGDFILQIPSQLIKKVHE
ncbi:hypothetical protein AGMMS49953_06780 [Endomicrobiia bacterium]|nr:hypothetical protein AGMMS49953_06780 [Endomicrobiia bacterium]